MAIEETITDLDETDSLGVNDVFAIDKSGTGVTEKVPSHKILASWPSLDSIQSLTPTPEKMLYITDDEEYALTDITEFSRSLLDDTNPGEARSTLLAAELGDNFDITNLNSLIEGFAITGNPDARVACGAYTIFTAGESVSFGDPCYVGGDNSLYKADGNNTSKSPTQFMAGQNIAPDGSGKFYSLGTFNEPSWSWVSGDVLYLKNGGGLTSNISESTCKQTVAVAINANLIFWQPVIMKNLFASAGANSDITSMSGITGTININRAPVTLTASGIISTFNAAETVAFGQPGYLTTSGTVGKADMDVAAKSPAQYFILGSATVGQPVLVLEFGYVTLSSWTWTPGANNPIYLSTAGTMSQSPTWITDSKMQKIAVPVSATTIRFAAEQVYSVHV